MQLAFQLEVLVEGLRYGWVPPSVTGDEPALIADAYVSIALTVPEVVE